MVKIVTRKEWGAWDTQTFEHVQNLNIQYIFLVSTNRSHCYNMTQCKAEVRRIQQRHMLRQSVRDMKYK